ncbi:dynein assembly factor 5, axonemal isoform X2 [Selaginella moellendorffii]|nr:dynein assembly factor 5, axonemal isoform X2 [Selaginella moellendorffii]|eukprot:XP_002970051.2 dynein assembly factor 5, axonemal isoform X2 [Selaginella moellendorffii]
MDADDAPSNAVDQAIAAADFVQTIQRDLNCLSDPDRNTRRKALERLDKLLVIESRSPAMLQIVWDETILKLVVRNLHDPVERCREAAVNMISRVVKLLAEVEQTTFLMVPAIAERTGQLPVLEHSEEIRLSLINLLNAIICQCSVESVREFSEHITRVICVTLSDSFHEIKKASCALLSRLCSRAPDVLGENADAILHALLPNILHAHSRVRSAVVSALNDVVLCGLPAGMIAQHVAPGVKAVAFDHSDAVRKVFFEYVALWLGYEPDETCPMTETKNQTAYMPLLLPLLLLGIGDDSPEISTSTLAMVYRVGEVYKHWNAHDSVQEKTWRHDSNVLPLPFETEPGYGSRLMIQRHLKQIVYDCSKDFRDWTVTTRLGAARLLQTTLVFAESHSSRHLDVLIPSLCSAVADDDVRVAQHVVKSSQILGFNNAPEHWLDLIMDSIISDRSTALQRANGLVVFAGLLYGTPNENVHEGLVIQILQGLCHANLSFDESLAVRRQLLAVLTNVVVKAGPISRVSSKEMLILLLQLQCIQDDAKLHQDAASLIETFAHVTGYESLEQLYACHTRDLIDRAILRHEEWLGNSPGRHLFEAVLKNLGHLAGSYLAEILPIIASCLKPQRDPSLRLSLLHLLDDLFETSGLESWWSSLAKEVIVSVLIPCGIWQAGKVGAAVRHAAMVAVGTYLRRGLCTQKDLNDILETGETLPVVISCLEEDFYVDTRRVTCHVMENIIRIAGNSLRDDYRVKIGAVLQKRLDDSNDGVRLGILRSLSLFLSTLPPAYPGTELKSCLSSLVLHMDDQNQQIKESVCKAVEVCAVKRPALVVEIVTEVRSKHQSSQYCDYLLTVAGSVQTADSVESAA